MNKRAAVVLAAGEGKRMAADHPKVVCEVLFKPLISHILDTLLGAGFAPADICVVVGPNSDALTALLPAGTATAFQAERLGTGHALMQCGDFMAAHAGADLLVMYGDGPFIDRDTIEGAYDHHRVGGYAATVLTAEVADPTPYGRIVRSAEGVRIVEALDATPEQRAIREINAGSFWFRMDFLEAVLPRLTDDNAQKQYYITDVLNFCDGTNRSAAYVAPDPDIVLGANNRRELARLNEIARRRVVDKLLDRGVDIPFPDQVTVGMDVTVEPGARLLPGTILKGRTSVARGSVIGPNTVIDNCVIDVRCEVNQSQLSDSRVGAGCRIGPFAQLRPGCILGEGVKIGNFVELKNATIGDQTSLAHLTYFGDADAGREVNVGCGVVTSNYDGRHKQRTRIDDYAFIGCNVNFVPPVRIGEGAYIAAATTVTEDVPADTLAIGRVRQENKPGRAKGRYKARDASAK